MLANSYLNPCCNFFLKFPHYLNLPVTLRSVLWPIIPLVCTHERYNGAISDYHSCFLNVESLVPRAQQLQNPLEPLLLKLAKEFTDSQDLSERYRPDDLVLYALFGLCLDWYPEVAQMPVPDTFCIAGCKNSSRCVRPVPQSVMSCWEICWYRLRLAIAGSWYRQVGISQFTQILFCCSQAGKNLSRTNLVKQYSPCLPS